MADAGPLHYLILIGAADVLEFLYHRIVIPETVAGELQAPKTPGIVRSWMVKTPAWCEIFQNPPPNPQLEHLDPGERAAITLALSIKADRLLIDEQAGRAEAKQLHLLVTGTLGVLAETHQAELLHFEEAIARINQTNVYASTAVVNSIRHRLFMRGPQRQQSL